MLWFVRMFMQYHKEDVPLKVIGMEVGLVVMVVQISHVVKLDMSISYMRMTLAGWRVQFLLSRTLL